ncbi:DNA cytosine methyltransferase [Streptomyces sp. MCL20-2]|uniref:DNA cytosine methyltransferase n=1 Tax=Streptomyces sp. MCL20-2 TaxID=2967219 RepID=UPI0029668F28|nr:DNA cytosine methyltransferase [Streptomyces sp. MCL20-2]
MDTDPDLIVEGFHGPGGWAEGRKLLGLTTRAVGMEWDAAACATAKAAGHTVVRCDVATMPTAPMRGRVKVKVDSPPCQAWSRAGKGLGLVDQPLVHQAVEDLAAGRDTRAKLLTACKDPRSLLAAEPMRWHHDLRPETIVMEEVPDVLPLFKQYAAILRAWGYSVWVGILNTADYGVPQTRRRAILIASRVRAVGPPPPTHTQHPGGEDLFGEDLPGWVCMADALGWGATDRPVPTVTAGGGKTGGAEPFPSQARAALTASRDRGDWVLRNGTQKNAAVRELDEPAGTLFFGARCNDVSWVLRNGNQPNAAVRSTDEPAPTMAFGNNSARVEWVQTRPATTVCATDRIAPPGHRDRSPKGESQFSSPDTVRITQAEAAVLQSFRADYPWQGTKTKQFEQIGNAVPPLLAAHVLSAATGIPMPAAAELAAA